MFNPKYTISPKLLHNIKHIATITEDLNNKKFPRLITVEMERNARALSAYSSTSIEGNPLPLTDVKNLLKNQPSNIRDTEREVLNYNRALEYLENLVNERKAMIDEPLILNIQKMVTEGLIENHRSGQIRTEPVFVNDPRKRQVAYLPPDARDVERLIDELLLFSISNEKILDPLIIAGIFHKQFVVIHPFVDGNGRTARLLSKILLARMGLNTFNLFSFENYYNRNVASYFNKVGLYGNYYDLSESVDFTEWLEYFTDGIIDELLRVKKELDEEVGSTLPRIRPPYQKIIDYLKEKGSISDSEYAAITKRAKSTRSLDLKNMVVEGVLERFGKGKSTYYRLKNKDI